MHTRCWGGYAAAAILVAARATPVIMVDDSDPGIEYRGAWTHNPWGHQDVNYGSTVTFTNASGSTATYKFQGTGVAVFGAFEMSGTFDVHSSYSVDDGPAMDFVPADTFVSFEYGQKFFQSHTLSDEEHTLVITNLGEEFWFDYLEVTQQPPPPLTTTTTSSQSTAPRQAQTPLASTARATSSTTDRANTGSVGQPKTAQSLSSPSSHTQSTYSLSNINNVTLTSPDTAATSLRYASSVPQSQTSILASGVTTPTSTAERTHSSQLSAGAIAGVAVAGLLALILVGWVGLKWCRRSQARRQNVLTPYEPGLRALAFKPSEKRDLEHYGNSRGSTTTSLLSLPPPTPAHPLPPAEGRVRGASGERNVPSGIGTTDTEETPRMSGDRRTGFEPLGSPSSASPLVPQHTGGMRLQKDSPITPSAGTSRHLSPLDERRRSVDGGVRLAGGPMENEEQDGDRGDDARSGISTLPPAYGTYQAA